MKTTTSTKTAALRLRDHLVEQGIEPSTGPSWRPWKHWAERFLYWYGQARALAEHGGLGMRPEEVAAVVRYNGPADPKGRKEQHVLGVMAKHTILEERGPR